MKTRKSMVCAVALMLTGAIGLSRVQAAQPTPPVSAGMVVYSGHQLIAHNVSLATALGKVRGLVPFVIQTPRWVPGGYSAAQLAVTPKIAGVSNGYTTLTYRSTAKGAGFQVHQASSSIAYAGGMRISSVKVAGHPATLREFKAHGYDLLILSGTTNRGTGYDVTTDAALSHLSGSTLEQIAGSLR